MGAGNYEVEVQPKNGKTFELEEMYKMLGCDMIEIVDLKNGEILIIDEEGKFKEHPIRNTIATNIARNHHAIWPMDEIVGDVLLCKLEEVE